MSQGPGYPLEAAARLRAHGVEEAGAALSEDARRLDDARRARAAAAEALRAHRAQAKPSMAPDAASPRPAVALLREAAYAARLRAEEAGLRARLVEALRLEAQAEGALRDARAALGLAAAEEGVLTRHRARWERAAAKTAERAQERAQEDEGRR